MSFSGPTTGYNIVEYFLPNQIFSFSRELRGRNDETFSICSQFVSYCSIIRGKQLWEWKLICFIWEENLVSDNPFSSFYNLHHQKT